MKIAYFAPTVKIRGMDGGATHVSEVVRCMAGEHSVFLITEGTAAGLPAGVVDVSSGNTFIKYLKTLVKGVRPSSTSDPIYERTDVFGVGSLLGILLGKPLVLETNSAVLEERVGNKIARAVLGRWLNLRYRKAKKIVVTLKSLVPPEFWHKVVETEWGVDLTRFNPNVDGRGVRKKLGLTDKKVVLFSGASGPWHGLQDLLAVVPPVRRMDSNIEFVCIGNIVDKNILKMADSQEGIRILGPVPYADVPSYLACADVLVAPFNPQFFPHLKKYGFYWSPLKIFEYMAMGKPIVSTTAVSRILKPGREGLLVKPGDVPAFADAIVYVLTHPTEAKAFGLRARKKAEQKYGWDVHVAKLMKEILS